MSEADDIEAIALALRDARTTLGKTATCKIGSDTVTISRSFFDSAIRNIDKAQAAYSIVRERMREMEECLLDAEAAIEGATAAFVFDEVTQAFLYRTHDRIRAALKEDK